MTSTWLRLALGIVAGAWLSGCVTDGFVGAEPIPLGNGVYAIGGTAGGAGRGMHDEGYQRAIRFCFEQGRQLLRVDSQPGMAQAPAGAMQFRCVGPGEPGWKEPVG